jgi:acetyl esterase/lipase
MYKGNNSETDFYCAPARQTDYTDLPAAFAIVGSADPFLDETLTYMKNLYSADIYEMHKVFEGCYHAFDMLNPRAPVTKKAAALEREAYQYAQKHFFAAQPLYEES